MGSLSWLLVCCCLVAAVLAQNAIMDICSGRSNGTFVEHPVRCSAFYRCGHNGQQHLFSCETGLYFNTQNQKCDPPADVDCTTRGGYDYSGSSARDKHEIGRFWGPAFPKESCRNVFCFVRFEAAGSRPFQPNDIDPRLCTHLLVTNVKLSGSAGVVPAGFAQESSNDIEKAFQSVIRIKEVYQDVKIMASVGHLDTIVDVKKTGPTTRELEKFAKSLTKFLRLYSFDGLHMHWTYQDLQDRPRVAKWLTTFRNVFDKEAAKSKKARLILTISIPPNKEAIEVYGFSISKNVDFAFLLGYELHGRWKRENQTHVQHFPNKEWTVHSAINYWVSRELPKEKLILGISLRPRRYKLDASVDTLPEILDPSERCKKSSVRAVDGAYGPGYSLVVLQDSEQSATVTVMEDKTSIIDKVRLVASQDLGGLLLADLNDDDFSGAAGVDASLGRMCGLGQNLLLKTAIRTCGESTGGAPISTSVLSRRLSSTYESMQRSHIGCNVLFCFYSNEFNKTSPMTQLNAQDVDPTYCTHLGYRSFLLTNTTEDDKAVVIKPSEDKAWQDVKDLASFRKQFPDLKVMVSIWDPTWDAVHFARMAQDDLVIERVAWEAIDMVSQQQLDGIDLDWTFPLDNSIERFPVMLEIFRGAFDLYAKITGRPRPKLSASVYSFALDYYQGQLERVCKAVDILRFDTSDLIFHYQLKKVSGEQQNNTLIDIDPAIQLLLQENVDPRKVVLALPLFAKVMKVRKIDSGPDGDTLEVIQHMAMPESNLTGKAVYPEVCRLRTGKGDRGELFLPRRTGQFLLIGQNNDTLISFEDETSLRMKIKLLRQHKLGGGFIKNLVADDFSGKYCKHGAFPLLSAIGHECTEVNKPDRRSSPKHFQSRTLAAVPTRGCELLVCYYEHKATQRHGKGKALPSDIDSNKCTHVIFNSAILSDTSIVVERASDLGDDGLYNKVVGLKTANPALKVLLSLHDSDQTTESDFRRVAQFPDRLRELAENCAVYLRKYNFDGVEIVWTYEISKHMLNDEKTLYTSLMEKFAATFFNESEKTGLSKLLLTARVSGNRKIIDTMYDVPRVADAVDFLLVDTYSWYTWYTNTYHYSPIFPPEGSRDIKSREENVAFAINRWLNLGAPSEKLVLGIGLYAHSFTLVDRKFWNLGDDSSEPGLKGEYTKTFGTLAYFEVCQLRSKDVAEHFLADQLVPFMVHEDQWIGFENEQSVRQKVRFSKLYKLGGVSLFSVDADDFAGGFCSAIPFPLLTAVRRECSVIGSEATQLKLLRSTPMDDLAKTKFRRVCYIDTTSLTRPKPATFDVAYITPGLCTHLILLSLTLDQEGAISSLTVPVLNAFRAMKLLKEKKGTAFFLFSISNVGFDIYSTVLDPSDPGAIFCCSKPPKMTSFLRSLPTVLRSQQADGVDFFLPELRSQDVHKLMDLLKNVRNVLESLHWWKNLTISLTLISYPLQMVDYKSLANMVNFFTVLSPPESNWSSLHHSLLVEDFQNIVNEYINKGVPRDKFIAGISLYGNVFYIRNKNQHSVGAPSFIGPKGATTGRKGTWAYYEVCNKMHKEGVQQSGYQQGNLIPYTSPSYYDGRVWISYDTRNRIQDKVMWLKMQDVGGYALYTLDADVFIEALCDFNIFDFPLTEGAYLASVGTKQFQSLVSAATTQVPILTSGPWAGFPTMRVVVFWLLAVALWRLAVNHLTSDL